MKKLFTFLISIIITISLVNGGWLLWKERFDLPQETKELIVGTIKNELSINAKCAKESCRKEVRNLENVLDEISYANQLGRLDTISLILALFGLILGFGAIYGFIHIKERSEDIAEKVAERESKKWLEENFESWLKRNPELLQKIVAKVLAAEKLEQESEYINVDIAKQDWS